MEDVVKRLIRMAAHICVSTMLAEDREVGYHLKGQMHVRFRDKCFYCRKSTRISTGK
jgi:hypothetical protein